MTTLINMSVKNYMVFAIIVVCLLITIWIQRINSKDRCLQKIRKSEYKTRFREEGVKITVSFDDCTIKEERRYATKRAKDYYRGSWKSLTYDNYSEIKVEYIDSIIEVNVEIDGLLQALECRLPFDRDTLLLKLYMQKEIDIYYDADTGGSFFDLRFID